MKGLLRAFALILLLMVGLISLARHGFSGAWIAFAAGPLNHEDIFLMTGDGGSVYQLTPDQMCADVPHWSPDGKWIAFFDHCADPQQLLRTRPGGAAAKFVSTEADYTYVQWSPHADWLIVARAGPSVYLIEMDSGSERLLAEGYINAQVSPDGEWVYARPVHSGGSSLDRIHVASGRVEPLLTARVDSKLSWSPDGKEIALITATDFGSKLVRMSPDGSRVQTIPLDPSLLLITRPHWSPDGEWIAFLGQEQTHWQIFRIRPDGRDLQRLTERGIDIGGLQWSPDSQWLTLAMNYQGRTTVFRLREDGSTLENLRAGASPQYAPVAGRDWHPLWLIIAVVGLFLASLVSRRGFLLRQSKTG